MQALDAQIVALGSKVKISIDGLRPGSRPGGGRLPIRAIVPQPMTLQAELLCHVVASTLDVITTNHMVTMHLSSAAMRVAVDAENLVRRVQCALLFLNATIPATTASIRKRAQLNLKAF